MPRTRPKDSCPVCKGVKLKKLFSSVDRLHGVPGEYVYEKCDTCQSVTQNPMIVRDDLPLCYPSTYYTHSIDGDPNTQQTIVDLVNGNNWMQRVRRAMVLNVQGKDVGGLIGTIARGLNQFRLLRERAFFGRLDDSLLHGIGDGKRALEIGCGNGSLLLNLRFAGWTVEGLEWDARSASIASQRTGEEIMTGDFRNVDFGARKFDLIVLKHVFEHLDEPCDALTRLASLLSSDGTLVLFYPNISSFAARIFKSDWFPWEVPRHLVLPSATGIRILAQRANLRVTEIRTSARYARYHFALSRKYRAGQQVSENEPGIARLDSILEWFEAGMNIVSHSLGEETIVRLQKN